MCFRIIVVIFLGLIGSSASYACTGIKLVAKDDSVIRGRTVEFGMILQTTAVVVPRGISFTGTTPIGQGLAYRSKYAATGMIVFDEMAIMDGMNERGLSVGTFFFPGYAEYAEISQSNQDRALSPIEFPHWILTQFATIDEMLSSLESVVIAPTLGKGWGSTPPPFHYIVFDRSGRSVVIEPLNGKLTIYENPLGILTNSPTFDWHMTNLHNYINLRSANASPLRVGALTFAPFGQGSGMVGLPGDFTPPSRFVRSFFFCTSALPSNNAEQAVFQAFHILNQFDIPLGIARSVEKGGIHADFTQVTCVCNPKSLKYYFKTYDDQTLRCVDLSKMDWNAKAIKKLSTSGIQKVVDITQELQ